jgi:hypothetical protein
MKISFHKTCDVSHACSLDQHDERLPFFHDIRGQLRPVAIAYVLHRVDRFSRDEKDLARVDRRGWLVLDLILQRPFEDVDDLFARMLVLESWRSSGLMSTRLWTTSRSGTLRSCRWRSVRSLPDACCSVLLMSPSVVSSLPDTGRGRRERIVHAAHVRRSTQ